MTRYLDPSSPKRRQTLGMVFLLTLALAMVAASVVWRRVYGPGIAAEVISVVAFPVALLLWSGFFSDTVTCLPRRAWARAAILIGAAVLLVLVTAALLVP